MFLELLFLFVGLLLLLPFCFNDRLPLLDFFFKITWLLFRCGIIVLLLKIIAVNSFLIETVEVDCCSSSSIVKDVLFSSKS